MKFHHVGGKNQGKLKLQEKNLEGNQKGWQSWDAYFIIFQNQIIYIICRLSNSGDCKRFAHRE